MKRLDLTPKIPRFKANGSGKNNHYLMLLIMQHTKINITFINKQWSV